jgi:anti-repressor protein
MDNTSIQLFNNPEFGQLRAVTDDSGEPWFVAKDVCDFLEITNRNRAMQQLDQDEKGGTHMYTPGGVQQVATINESGLYRLLLTFTPTKANNSTSKQEIERKRKVERIHGFQRWVTHDVLPAIRKRGGYMVARQGETKTETLARAVLIATDALKEKDARIAELEPKALFADAVAASDGTCLVGELAKMLRQNGVDIGQNRLFSVLRQEGYLGSVGQNRNVPTQRAMDMGLFRIKETAITHSDGHVSISRTTKVTGKGQRYFIDCYTRQGALA